MRNLSVIVLTFNEELNLAACLQSLSSLDADVYVVDSGSTDQTRQIAADFGCHVSEHPFINQAEQINWALANLPIKTEWIMRLDADEFITPELALELRDRLPQVDPGVSGVLIKLRIYFLGRWIRHGGWYPFWMLRIWRRGKAVCEQRLMDEHIVVSEGTVINFKSDFVNDNKKDLSFFTAKHNSYSDREVKSILASFDDESVKNLSGNAKRQRWLKLNLYRRTPLFFRAFAFWFYRYILRLGFLDGVPGLVYYFLQAFWYRFLVDAKIYELRKSDKSQLQASVNQSKSVSREA